MPQPGRYHGAATSARASEEYTRHTGKDLLRRHKPGLESYRLSQVSYTSAGYYCIYSVAVVSDNTALVQEDSDYWRQVVEGLDKQQTLDRLRDMDLVYAFGVTSGMLTKRPSCFEDFVSAKMKHPRMIIICKVCKLTAQVACTRGLDRLFCTRM